MKQTRYAAYTKVNYRYQLAEDLIVKTSITPATPVFHPFFTLSTEGWLIIKQGYSWDGISGPMIQTRSSVKGTAVHDCFYQMMRLGLLDRLWKPWADDEMKRVFIESGMLKIRAHVAYRAVTRFGSPNTDPKKKRRVYLAP